MENVFSFFRNTNFDDEIEAINGLTSELRVQYVVNMFENRENSIIFVCSSIYESNQYYQKFLQKYCHIWELHLKIQIQLQ